MSKFKVGDVVKCVDFLNISNLNVGVTYSVIDCNKDYVTLDIDMFDTNYNIVPSMFSVNRFEKVDGDATYTHSYRQKYPMLDDEDENEPTMDELAMRLQRAEDLLEKVSEVLEDVHYYTLAEEINEFLEKQ